MSAPDRAEMVPSGRKTRLADRVAWAKAYLQQAGLLHSPRRGQFQISQRGQEVLAAPPDRIDIKFLEQYAEFEEFRSRKGTGGQEPRPPELETPEEALDSAHLQIRANLAAEVLGRVKQGSAMFFESLVVELLLRMGYGGARADAGRVLGGTGDEGIDGVISEDRLGLDIVYLQAKKWEGTVGRPEIQKFIGALHGKRARKGGFITTGTFSSEAASYVEHIDPKVALIDGKRLAELMIDFGVGVTTARTYEIKRVDSDYFDEG